MAIYRIPWDSSDTAYSSGTGAWDDPTAPHPQGNGLYSWGDGYAKDYGRGVDPNTKIGGRVLAARAGLVTQVRQSIGPYPAMGAAGGNYVAIQHADGTLGVYAHLAQNRVQVAVGAWVPQGWYIADSGDTGNTGGAGHLHFSVLTYLTDDNTYGPTILHHYEATAAANYTGVPPAANDPNPQPDPHFFRPRNAGSITTSPIWFRQDGWRNCGKCQGLFFESLSGLPPAPNTASVCPADHFAHTKGGSGNYQLVVSQYPGPVNAQTNWRWCRKCGILFYPNAGSKCPADNLTHDQSQSGDYMPILGADDASNLGQAQSQWKYCWKCKAMFFGPNKASSVCPVDSLHHDDSGSGNYFLKVTSDDVQRQWRRCGKCQSIYFTGNALSYCPVTTPTTSHVPASDGQDYIMTIDSPDAAPGLVADSPPPVGQHGWRACYRCGGLWMSLNSGSVCPAPGGGSHSSSGSADYALVTKWSGTLNTHPTLAPGEPGWSWCWKCQSLWMGLQSGSRCPADGLSHSSSGSGNYSLQYSTH